MVMLVLSSGYSNLFTVYFNISMAIKIIMDIEKFLISLLPSFTSGIREIN